MADAATAPTAAAPTPVVLHRRRPEPPPPFPNYTQIPTRVSITAWRIARVAVLAVGVAVIATLFVAPDTGLTLFWRLVVPLLPLVWFAAPGVWRNLCPLATSNQVARVFGFTRGGATPAWLARFAYVIGLTALLLLIPARKVLFNRSGAATATLLLVVLLLAFAGGVLFKGKSGWCSTICPLLPVQRLYGETPFLLVRNSHCEPCVGCAKNCYDFNPRVAKLADLADDDPRYAAPRRWFAAAYPGLVLGFFTMANLPAQSTVWVYGRIALFVALSVAAYSCLETFVPVSAHVLTASFAALGLNAFYWFSVPILVDTLGSGPQGDVRSLAVWLGRATVLALTVPWLVRTVQKEAPFLAATSGAAVVAHEGLEALRSKGGDAPSVEIDDGPEIEVPAGTALLDVLESAGTAIEAGCRLGVCGSDPVAIVDGADSLSPVGADEASTLDRLGVGANVRLACQARVHGACRVSLDLRAGGEARPTSNTGGDGFEPDPEVRRLVIVGTGIAGATAADHARRLHPDCEIEVVGDEAHRLYNRMAISRLIYGRSAMQGLYLLPDRWYDDHDVTCWLNTRAQAIDTAQRTVTLATGERIAYDRLILANGSSSVALPLDGIDLAGSFALRDADDAIAIRAHVQRYGVRSGLVAGGGVLGVEAAYALHRLGLDATLVAQSAWLMPRQLDETAARIVERYLDAIGITVVMGASVASLAGDGRVEAVVLADGRRLETGLFLACPGVAPNTRLAADAGIAVDRGVVVDDRMQTSDPHVFAAGDLAQWSGDVVGLWPSSARQGEIAAVNAVGGDLRFVPVPSTTLLKVSGIDVASIGWATAGGEVLVELVVEGVPEEGTYRKLVVEDGRAVGAILVGHPLLLPSVQAAVENRVDLSGVIDELRAGDWSVLPAP